MKTILFISDFIDSVYRGRASFFLRKLPMREFFLCLKGGFSRYERALKVALFFPGIYVDEADLCSVANQLQSAVQIELSHDIGAVVFNCLRADE